MMVRTKDNNIIEIIIEISRDIQLKANLLFANIIEIS